MSFQVQTVVVVVSHDQVRAISAANQLHSNAVHVALNVGRGCSRSAVSGGIKCHVTPEAPSSAVDAAVGAGGRSGGDGSSQAHDILTAVASAIAVQASSDLVLQLGFSHLDAAFQQQRLV